MNCHDFDANVGEVVSGHLMDVEQREKALTHAASCARCRSQLADERALTSGLRAIARASEEQAPARVEAALLDAFRREHEPFPAFSPAQATTQRWWHATAAVAATTAIVMLFTLMASRNQDSQPATQQNAADEKANVPDQVRPASSQRQPVQLSTNHAGLSGVTGREPRRAYKIGNAGRSKPPADSLNKPAAQAEIATDFIPLMDRESFAQLDGAQVVRVELPRSALMSFGLPMDMERATERIKADVVVGNDGLARAIRFVR